MKNLEEEAIGFLVRIFGVDEGEINRARYERDLLLSTFFQTDEYMYGHEFFYEKDGNVSCKMLQKTRINEGMDKADQSATGQNPPTKGGISSMFEEAHNSPTKRGESSFNPLKNNSENPPSKRGESSFDPLKNNSENPPSERGESSFNPLKNDSENPPTKRGENPPSKRVEDLELEIAELKKEIKRLSKFEEKMKSRRKITQEQVEMVKELLLEGKKTQAEIVKLSGTSNGTLWRVKRGFYD